MRGTVIIRFIGNRQEPEEFLAPDECIFWPPTLPKELDEYMLELQKRIVNGLNLMMESTARGKSNPT